MGRSRLVGGVVDMIIYKLIYGRGVKGEIVKKNRGEGGADAPMFALRANIGATRVASPTATRFSP